MGGSVTEAQGAKAGKRVSLIERECYRDLSIGWAKFEEIARAQISGTGHGFLKMVADPADEQLLGVQAIGNSATELVHLGQLAPQNAQRSNPLLTMSSTFRPMPKPIASPLDGE